MDHMAGRASQALQNGQPRPTGSGSKTRNLSDKQERRVRALWMRMTQMYGTRWSSSYGEIPAGGVSATMCSWARAIDRYPDEAIRWALDALDQSGREWPPARPEFIQLLKSYPRPQYQALPRPKPDPRVAEKHLGEMRTALAGGSSRTSRDADSEALS